jgi:hypothetical protein
MREHRKPLVIGAAFLLLLAAGMWATSLHVTPQTVFPGRSPTYLSLKELNEVQLRFLIARYSAYASAGGAVICLLAAFPPPVRSSTCTRPRAKRVRATIIASAIAGILGGLISSLHGDDGTFLSSPLNYAPGLIFGLCFARVNFSGARWITLYTAASGLIYLVAYYTHQAFSSNLSIESLIPQCLTLMFAGAIGGLGLAITTKLLAGTPLELEDEVGVGILGAVAAIPFYWLFFVPVLGLCLAFALWQIAVGRFLAVRLEKGLVLPAAEVAAAVDASP